MYKNFYKYEIFEDGRIWSKVSKKFLKPKTTRDGYQIVGLYDNNGKRDFQLVHKIVYFAVNGLWEYPNGMQINHIDEDKTNNHISNLELVTPKQNINYGKHNERVAKARSKRVGAFKDGELVMVYESAKEAMRNGFDKSAVCKCCRNCYCGGNKYKGYTWKYLEDN